MGGVPLTAPSDDDLGWPDDDLWTDEPATPQVIDDNQANRALWTLRRLTAEGADVDRLYAAELARLNEWRQRRSQVLDAHRDRLEQAVSGWALAVNADDPKRKTFDLPNGTVRIRPRQPKVEVDGSQESLALLAKDRPGWVRTKLEPEKAAIKKGVVARQDDGPVMSAPEGWAAYEALDGPGGEPVPGVTVLVPVGPSVTIQPAG